MHDEHDKILGIVNELIKHALTLDAQTIEVKITNEDEYFEINVHDNGKGMKTSELLEEKKYLTQPRRQELEEYYSGLLGNTSTSKFNIIGMLVDEAEMDSVYGQGTTIRVLRHKL